MKKIVSVRKEDNQYFQGPFWIIADSVKDIHRGKFCLIGEKYLSNYSGEYLDTSLSKSNRTHKKIWDNKLSPNYNFVPYNYYPRGRVAIYEGTAFIHINSKCNIPSLIDRVIDEYELDGLEIEIDLNDIYQGSHYDFLLK